MGKRTKRKFTRSTHRTVQGGGGHGRVTLFNSTQARTELNLQPTACSQQIASAIAPPKPRSPLKKALKNINRALAKDNSLKDKKIFTMKQKNKLLETAITDLTKQLLLEKKVSNMLIDQSKTDAEAALMEAYYVLSEAQKEKSSVEAWKLAEKARNKEALRKERAYSARQLEASKFILVLLCSNYCILTSFSYLQFKLCKSSYSQTEE